MPHSPLHLVAEGAGGCGCTSYLVHVVWERCVVAAAEPGKVDPVFPREGFFRGIDRGRVGA